MNEFLNMGGHGAYIWPCYLVAFVLLVGLLLQSMRTLSKSRRDLAIMEQISAPKVSDVDGQTVGEQA